ncbi:huntingtin-interacting protein 1-like [Sycon ciliatum]|uniref:huntingtin-interacting protein 1-like n=1 Tax=Sycon ciliatum TaxID=27933 RepID=UPI0031F714F6
MAHTSAKKGISKVSGVPMVDFDVLMKEATEFISKALSKDDAPPKEKHVRSTVVSTFQENGCTVFWSIVESRLGRLPFTAPIVGYKTCFTYHRILRDGHPNVMKQSKGRYQQILHQMRSGFDFIDDHGYCKLTGSYIKFLLEKVDLHLNNEFLPGLIREDGIQLTIFKKPNMDLLFELLTTLLTYLETQVEFVTQILGRLDPSAKLPTSHTHCVIHPLLSLIPESFDTWMVIQETYVVLTNKLDSETLKGHRERALASRSKLSSGLTATTQLSYVMSILVKIPVLPNLPEAFTKPKPVEQPRKVELPQPVDARHTFNRRFSTKFDFQSGPNERQLQANARQIAELNAQIEKLKAERMEDHQRLFDAKNETQMLKNEIAEMKRENAELKDQVEVHTASMETSEHLAAANAKFTRLKELYTELRNNHVDLIREKAKAEKQAATLKDQVVDLDAEKEAVASSLEAAQQEQDVLKDTVRRMEEHISSIEERSSAADKEAQDQIELLNQELKEREEKLEKLNIEFTTEQAEKKNVQAQLEQSQGQAADTQTKSDSLEATLKEQIANLETQLQDGKQKIEKLQVEFETEQGEAKRLGGELSNAQENIVLLKQNSSSKDKELTEKIESLQTQLSERQQEMEKLTVEFSTQQSESQELAKELAAAQELTITMKKDADEQEKLSVEKIEGLHKQLSTREDEYKTMTVQFTSEQEQTTQLKTELTTTKDHVSTQSEDLAKALAEIERLRADMEARLAAEKNRQGDLNHSVLVQAMESAQEEIKEAGGSGTRTVSAAALVDCTQSALRRCDELSNALEDYQRDDTTVPQASASVNHLSHSLCRIVEDANSVAAANSSTAMVDQVHRLTDVSNASLEALKAKNADSSVISQSVSAILDVVKSINSQAKELVPAEQKQIEEVGRSVESQMNLMADAVTQAAKRIEAMMERSKETDTGEQLEVNSRILDSSSDLMEAIRVLIEQSRALQKEIVDGGRGNLSADQYYQKNSRWTEGLLSAAQMVGHGAQHLVECADQVVTGKGKFEELEVASHDIAASTAQLVAASQAKADRNSKLLVSLKAASKIVTEKTGHVVVSAKSGVKAKKKAEQPDFTKLSAIQGKRREMEIQVRLLELESEVEHTREQLGEVRRLGYSGANNNSSRPGGSGKTSPY